MSDSPPKNLPILPPTNPLSKLAAVNSPLDIPTSDVVKLVLQFLEEQGLYRSLHTLQEESQITTNTVQNSAHFLNSVENGQWTVVLKQLAMFRLPLTTLTALYDLIILELCELEQFEAALALFQQSPVFLNMKNADKLRYDKLNYFISQQITEQSQLFEKLNKKSRRQNVSNLLKGSIIQVPKSRLLNIITNSLRYQQLTGTLPQHASNYNIFTDTLQNNSIETQKPVHEIFTQISLHLDDEIDSINTMFFTPNGKYLITGNDKGMIEIWDFEKGIPTEELLYQRNEQYMMHFFPITKLAMSKDHEVLASGASNGDIKIWSFYTGQVIINLKQAHSSAITHIQFSSNGLNLLTASNDNIVKVWDLQNQINTHIYQIDHGIAFVGYPSVNLSNLDSEHVLVLDTSGIFYLFFEQDLVLKKQLISSTSTQVSSAQTLTSAVEKSQSNNLNNNGLDMGTLLGRGGGGGGGSTSITTTNTVVSLYSCNIIPIRPDVLLLCSKNDQAVHLMDDKNGEIVASFNGNNFKENEQKNDKKLTKFKTDFTFACTSALSRYIYALGTDNTITVFDFDNKTIEKVFNPHDSALITTICHHPHRNILATTSSDGFIKIWK